MGQTLLDRASDALRKANEMLDAAAAADREGKTADAKQFRYRREIALREALGHLKAVSIPIEDELRLAAIELNKPDKKS
jgi:hypothetical protein